QLNAAANLGRDTLASQMLAQRWSDRMSGADQLGRRLLADCEPLVIEVGQQTRKPLAVERQARLRAVGQPLCQEGDGIARRPGERLNRLLRRSSVPAPQGCPQSRQLGWFQTYCVR